MIGIILGVTSGMFAIFLAAFFAIIPAIYSNFVKKDVQTPFIPYLVLGFFTEYFFDLETIIKVFY
jgi:leader peptidase (prepilin peptidase) / N-methyltransferase